MLFLGATLPGGQMIRESPTRPSRGGTAIIPLPDGTYLVHSFFDIFVDLSVDSGTTWTAASNGPVRMELRQQAPEVATTTPDLPLTNSPYVSPAQWHALYAAGIIITNVSHDRFTQQLPPPPPGGGQVENFGSTVTGQISADGGATFQPFAGFANASVQVTSHSSLDNGTTRFFDTEMLSLDLNSPAFMIRESPSKASLGKTSVRTTAPGDHHISSFFDVFTEVSLDGGLNWLTSISRPATMSPRPNGPTPTPIVLTCSSNITVTENTPGGAIVTYLSSASGACIPPPVVSCFPLSGSIFPVGTTIVTCTASDTCGNSTNCTFKITVVPEYFNPTNSLPPSNTVYISPAQWHVLFAQGIIIRDVRHRFFTQSLPPPPLGATQVHSFNSRVDFEYSNDGGATFQPASANVPVSVRVTHTADTTSGSQFDTEMLSLNLVSGNIRLRESPTLASTGRTTVRAVPGGYMIGSFFDVFTEVSLDGGATWQPAQEAAHVEMRNDPRRVATVTEPTQLLPPPNEAYVSPAKWHALYAQGIVIRDVRHKLFTGSLPPPPAGGSNVHTFNSTLDLQLSTDGGNSFQAVRASAPVQVSVRSVGSGNSGMFETEMLQLDISGGTLPASVRLRESPTRPSRGATQIDSQPDGTQRIGSFFDIFAEVSTDGGNTWNQASNGPVRLQVTQQAPETPASSQNLPLTNSPYVSPAQWHAAYANGIYISNVTHRGFTQNYPPPPPGGTNDENFDSTVDMQVSLDSGQTFVPASCTMSAVVRVISRPPLDSGSTRTFDTEMLALDISGGSLPNGIRLRESPTRQSLGRTSVRPDPSGVGYRVSSFFDIFTDVSVDGGNTWLPATTPPASMSPRLMAKKRVFPNANMPPTNGQYISPKQWHALYANGIIISNVSHKRFLANFTPPPPRSTNTHNFGSQVDFLLKLPGQTFQPMTANADCQVSVANTGFQGSESVYQTEMLALNLSGGSLPPGVMIRESPTRRSTGEARGSAAAGGGSRLGSFFDIFTEVSLDGGNTWSQADSPGSMELHLDPGSVPTAMMQPRLEGGHLAVSVATQTGLQYLLQYKSEIEAPTWTTLSITPGNGQSQTLTDTSPLGSRRYYRVEVQEDDLQADGDWSKPLELP
ncbi:MAG: HYR domain-containing protein [Pedosphaera sp.]|nr:HYR domain-containing protein [Pedosphaera sp.]